MTGNGSPIGLEFDAKDYQQGVIITDIGLQHIPEPGRLALLCAGVMSPRLVRRRRPAAAR